MLIQASDNKWVDACTSATECYAAYVDNDNSGKCDATEEKRNNALSAGNRQRG